MVNQSYSASGIPSCADLIDSPIVQDNDDGGMWTALSATTYTLVVVDENGLVANHFDNATFPEKQGDVELALEALLGP